jgi:hypothetical protein
MAWRIFELPAEKKEALELVLQDNVLWRQTRIFKEASLYGGKAGDYYLYMNGADEAMARADTMVPPIGKKLTGADAEKVYAQIREEEDRAASGMGMIFPD